MSSKHEQKYARALDDLDARRDAGKVSTNEYELQRQRLLTEAGKQRWHWGIQAGVILAVIVAALLVLRLFGTIVNAANS